MAEPTIWDYEAKISRRFTRRTPRGWTRRAIFDGIPAASAAGLIPAEYTPWPGEDGKTASVLVYTDIEHDARPGPTGQAGEARVTLLYRPLTWIEWLEQNPNKAVLLGQSAASGQRVRRVGSTILEGIDPDDSTGKSRWKVDAGSNAVFTQHAVYQVFSIVSDPDVYFYQFVSKIGCYNSTVMYGLPLAPEASTTGQWLLSRISCAPRPNMSVQLWTVKYSFMLDIKGGWQNPCVSRMWCTEALEVPVRDNDGNVVGTAKTVILRPTPGTVEVNLIPEGNFSVIDGMLLDSW